MAKFKITNLKIKPVGLKEDGTIDPVKNPTGKLKYAVCDLINTVYAYDTPKKHVIFEEAFVELLTPYVSIQNGGTAQTDLPLPEELMYIQGAWAEWISPVPFYKRYLTDQKERARTLQNPKGRPAIKAGAFVQNADGSANVVFNKIEVFVEFYKDPDTGNTNYLKGKTVEALGIQNFSNYCVAIGAGEGENNEERGGITPQPQTQQQPPVQTQTQPQGQQQTVQTPPPFTNPQPQGQQQQGFQQ